MENFSEALNNKENKAIQESPKINSNSIFITKNYMFDFNISKENEKICEFCKSKFYSKFNKERHVNKQHLKSNLEQNLNIDNTSVSIQQDQEKNKVKEEAENKDKKLSKFIGFKRHPTASINNNQSKNLKQKITSSNSDKCEKENIIDLEYTIKKKNNNNLSLQNTEQFSIISNKQKYSQNIREVIISNFYEILKNNEYNSFGNYFMFKKKIIGCGKYGTVFFGLDLKNVRPIAIKISNCEKRNESLKTEIAIMKKLSKYKFFSKIYDEIIIDNKIYLCETLQGPNLYRLKQFCGGKFSTITAYKIGIEVLKCLKLIHKIGYLYLDLKDDNIAILHKPIMYNKMYNSIILIDYGLCVKFFSNENESPRLHGNIRYSSANALKGNPVSRKDDIISFCYFLADICAGFLPWEDISSEYNIKDETIKLKENYPFKNLCGVTAKEILFIFNDANCLNFCEAPNYNNYIYLLENYLKVKTGKTSDNILFDWDEKLINFIESSGGVKNAIKDKKEIRNLFEGYPNFYINEILEKYNKK
jgi:hypothetical protein